MTGPVPPGGEELREAENVHVHAVTATQHGHPGACCCLVQMCQATDCDINATKIAALRALRGLTSSSEEEQR